MVWPDILIAAVLLIAGLKGFKRGFIMELSGAVALVLSLIVPWFYNGVFDEPLQQITHAGPGAAHVIALFCVGAGTYLAVLLIARVLNAVAKLPVLGLGNAVAGAAIALLKAAILIWLVLYVALFFPLTRDVRADLHRSKAVAVFALANDAIDNRIEATLPPFVRPMFAPVLDRHRV
ncbi:MAG TPA: CvpA family protein [Candidatus Baltobacteraceae bacterium]|nr:CvpA family protein [Candidatus Baltobacteraceae bacterium]